MCNSQFWMSVLTVSFRMNTCFKNYELTVDEALFPHDTGTGTNLTDVRDILFSSILESK